MICESLISPLSGYWGSIRDLFTTCAPPTSHVCLKWAGPNSSVLVGTLEVIEIYLNSFLGGLKLDTRPSGLWEGVDHQIYDYREIIVKFI